MYIKESEEKIKGYSLHCKGAYDLLFGEKGSFHIKCRNLLVEYQMTKVL